MILASPISFGVTTAFLAAASPPYQLHKKSLGPLDSRLQRRLQIGVTFKIIKFRPKWLTRQTRKCPMSDVRPLGKALVSNCIKNKRRRQQQHYIRSFASEKPYLCYTKKKRKKEKTRQRCCWWWWICPDFDTKTNKKKMENCKIKKKREERQ